MQNIIKFMKNEAVFVISSVFAVLSMLIVPPSIEYFGYIDFSVLILLFCLMAVVSGFVKTGLFNVLSKKLIEKSKSIRLVSILLINFTFFSAMLITNDVALITFVPLTIGILHMAGENRLIFVIVMETIAANLGSMVTPIGNPQNLYLYCYYEMNIIQFLRVMLPLGAFSYLVIMIIMLTMKNGNIEISLDEETVIKDKRNLWIYFALFLLCILTVLHLINYMVCFTVVTITIFATDKEIFKRIDYGLLLTFTAFFVFVGNLSNIDLVKTVVSSFIENKELFTSVLISQIISNVPAAIMLSGFTDNVNRLLLGVNIGGLGTLIASLASLISFRLYTKSIGACPFKYLKIFTLYNVGILIVLIIICKAFM